MVIVVDINGFTVKRILVDNRSSCNVFTWKASVALQVNITRLEKVNTSLVGIRGKPMTVKGSVELPITLGDKDTRRLPGQSFMVAKIDVPYNTIFSRPLLNKLCSVLFPWYLMMKFEMDKGIATIKGD